MDVLNKLQLQQAMESGYRDFKQLLAGFDDGQACQPGIIGKWSLKDTAAHILVHEQRMIAWMRARLYGAAPPLPQPYAMPDAELDNLNEQIYQENRDRPLEDVMQALDETHAEALHLVADSSEADLFDPSRFRLQAGKPLWEAVAANTFSHYEEHGQDIRLRRS
jgi:hypothetical protein